MIAAMEKLVIFKLLLLPVPDSVVVGGLEGGVEAAGGNSCGSCGAGGELDGGLSGSCDGPEARDDKFGGDIIKNLLLN